MYNKWKLVMAFVMSLLLISQPLLSLQASAEPIVEDTVILIGTEDPGYSETGVWSDSSVLGYDGTITRFTGELGAYATWTPEITTAGTYRVSLFKPAHSSSDPESQIEVVDAHGTSTVTLDFTVMPSEWVVLGDYYFEVGNAGYVKNTLVSYGTIGRADAVKFERVDTSPVAVLNEPANLDGMPVDGAFELQFSKYMDSDVLTEDEIVLKQVSDDSVIAMTITVSEFGKKVRLQPVVPLQYDTAYLLSIDSAVTDLEGKALTGQTEWAIRTVLADVEPPTATIEMPLVYGLATASAAIEVRFSEPMDAATLSSENIILREAVSGQLVPYDGQIGDDASSYAIHPLAHLNYGMEYELVLTNDLADQAGNAFSAITYSFATALASNTISNLYVSPEGDDDNPGTLAAPLATIDKARQVVRGLNANMQGDITVHIGDGVYPLTETLRWDAADSGSNGYAVRYQAKAGETPMISGGQPLTGWQQVDSGPLWKADADDKQFRQLYVNGKRAVRAESSETVDAIGFNQERNGLIMSSDVIGDWENADAMEFVWNKSWRHHRVLVDSITPGPQAGEWNVTFQQPYLDWALTSGYLAFAPNEVDIRMVNAFELLDTPGEWYLNETSGEVYYYPLSDEDMTTAEVIAPQLERLVEIKGTLDEPVHHIEFHGLTFQHGDWMRPSEQGLSTIQGDIIASGTNQTGGNHEGEKVAGNIVVHAAENIRFERNRIEHMGAAGIVLEVGASDIHIAGNILTDISASGIIVGDMRDAYPDDPRQVNRRNVIENNVIYNIGTEYWNSLGIFALYVESIAIAHNEMYDFPYTGVSLGWGWGAHQESGIMSNNHVVGNHIHHGMYGLNDGGAVYLLGKQPGTTIAGNLVHDNHNLYGGIYLDTGSIGMTVTDNITYRVPSGLINWNMFKYNITDPALDPDNDFYSNYFGFSPEHPSFPETIAEQAGLQPAYRDLLAGLPDPVVPSVTVTEEEEMTVIVANGQPGYTEEGTWATSSLLGYDGQSLTRYSVSLEASVEFRPALLAGKYRVYYYNLINATSDPNALVEITHADGIDTQSLNQTTGDTGWVDLGEYPFEAGTDGYVLVTRGTSPEDNSYGYLRASAVKFVRTADLDETDPPIIIDPEEEPGEGNGNGSGEGTGGEGGGSGGSGESGESGEAGEGQTGSENGSGSDDGAEPGHGEGSESEAGSENGEGSEADAQRERICAEWPDACGNWSEAYLLKLMQAGWIQGFPDGTVKPEQRLSRAEMVTILVRALQLPKVEGSQFTDIAQHWSKESIETAAAHHIVEGITDTLFQPNGIVTREQLAVLVVRAFKLDQYADAANEANGVNEVNEVNEENEANGANMANEVMAAPFGDHEAISPWAKSAVNLLRQLGIVTGYEDGTFKPQQGVSRAEAATVLARIMEFDSE